MWLGPALILISVPSLFAKPAVGAPRWAGIAGCATRHRLDGMAARFGMARRSSELRVRAFSLCVDADRGEQGSFTGLGLLRLSGGAPLPALKSKVAGVDLG